MIAASLALVCIMLKPWKDSAPRAEDHNRDGYIEER